METLGYVASVLMGVFLGLMGGGGSILTVPILVYLFGFAPGTATAYSLFIVGSTALIGGAASFRKGEFEPGIGLAFAVPSLAGVHVSRAIIVPLLPDTIRIFRGIAFGKDALIMAVFAVLMVAASLSMLRPRRQKAAKNTPRSPSRLFLIGVLGALVGVTAGFVGAGGGFLIIPALVVLAGLPMRVAAGTSLAIIATQSLFGFAGDVARGLKADWAFLGTVVLLAVAGVFAGAGLAARLEEEKTRTAFGWFVLLAGAAILAEQVRHA